MVKEEVGLLSSSIIIFLIFVYGIKTKRSWRYWLATLLFLPTAAAGIGIVAGSAIGLQSMKEREAAKRSNE